MGFKPKDIKDGYFADIRAGKNKKRYYRHEGRKPAFYIWVTGEDGDTQSVVKFITKDVKPDKVKLRGPDDLKKTESFKNILEGERLKYPFLTKIENRILTMRAVGRSRAQIARTLNGEP